MKALELTCHWLPKQPPIKWVIIQVTVNVSEDEHEYEASSSKASECFIRILSQFRIDLSLIVLTRIWQWFARIWIILPSIADTEPHDERADSEIDFKVRLDYSDDKEELHELQSDPKSNRWIIYSATKKIKQAVISPVFSLQWVMPK